MIVNGNKIDVDKLTKDVYDDKNMMKMRAKGIYLSDNQINVLKKYNIDYNKYTSIKSLIFDIEEILNDETNLTDLEEVSEKLSELNYYNYTNK